MTNKERDQMEAEENAKAIADHKKNIGIFHSWMADPSPAYNAVQKHKHHQKHGDKCKTRACKIEQERVTAEHEAKENAKNTKGFADFLNDENGEPEEDNKVKTKTHHKKHSKKHHKHGHGHKN